jgi:hypothetical protein
VEFDHDGCYPEQSYLGQGDRMVRFMHFSHAVLLVTLAVGLCGIVGNLVSVAIFARKETRNCFSDILIALNLCDSLHIVLAILENLRNNLEDSYPAFLLHLFPHFHYPVYRITMCCSVFLVMASAVERYLAVCRPHHFRIIQHRPWRSLSYILPCLAAAVLMNVPRFWDTEVALKCWDFSHCGCEFESWMRGSEEYLRPTQFRANTDYAVYFPWLWDSVTGYIPFVVLTYLNLSIFAALRRLRENLATRERARAGGQLQGGEILARRLQQRRKDCDHSVVLVVTILLFLAFHTPRVLMSVYESVSIQAAAVCSARQRGYFTIWYLYAQATVQLLQVTY